MPQILHSVAVQEQAVASDGVQVFDLAVNPLSVVLIVIRPLNETTTAADFVRYMGICGSLARVSILHQGVSVQSMSGRDMAALNYFRHGIIPPEANSDATNNERRAVVLPVLLGRFAYDPTSCFPKTRRGELQLELDIDIADTGYDGYRLSIETIELLDASPREFERKVTQNLTFSATGINDFDMPLGHRVRGLLCFGTTGFAGASPAPTWGRMATYVNNAQVGIAATDFEVAHMLSSLSGRQHPANDAHVHIGGTGAPEDLGTDGWQNYAFLDFDPTRDDMFAIETSGASRFHIQADAEAAEAVRVIPIERIGV